MTRLRMIADQLAAALEAASFAEIEQITGRLNLDPTPPCIDIYPGNPLGSDAERGFGDPMGGYVFTVRVRAAGADNESMQDLLLDLMDWDEGLAQALEDDQTLNGYASSVSVSGPTGMLPYRGRGEEVLVGCEWSVKVLPENS